MKNLKRGDILFQMLQMQKELQADMKQFRERDLADERASAIAECIELMEELPLEDNHKTWKEKEFSREKLEKEFIDILFFIAQYLITCKMDSIPELIEGYEQTILTGYNKPSLSKTKTRVIHLINALASECGTTGNIFFCYGSLGRALGIDLDRMLVLYKEKFEENMTREDFTR